MTLSQSYELLALDAESDPLTPPSIGGTRRRNQTGEPECGTSAQLGQNGEKDLGKTWKILFDMGRTWQTP